MEALEVASCLRARRGPSQPAVARNVRIPVMRIVRNRDLRLRRDSPPAAQDAADAKGTDPILVPE